jgi:hypothetical protein
MPVCSGRLAERKHPVDGRWRHVVLVEEPEQSGEVTRTPHRGAEQVELTEVERPDVQRDPLAARRTQHDEPTARPHGGERRGPGADRVQDDVEAFAAGRQLRRRRRPAGLVVTHSSGGAQFTRSLDLRRRRGGDDHLAADRRAERHRHRRDPAAGAEHEQRLPRAQSSPGEQSPVRGQAHQWQRRRLGPAQIARLRYDALPRDADQLRIGAGAMVAEDLPPRPRSRLVVPPPQRRQHQDLVAGLHVDAGAVGAWNVRQRRVVPALPDQHVVPVEGRGPQKYDGPRPVGDRVGKLRRLQYLRATEAPLHDSAHGSPGAGQAVVVGRAGEDVDPVLLHPAPR